MPVMLSPGCDGQSCGNLDKGLFGQIDLLVYLILSLCVCLGLFVSSFPGSTQTLPAVFT